jgi:hypothetical protein
MQRANDSVEIADVKLVLQAYQISLNGRFDVHSLHWRWLVKLSSNGFSYHRCKSFRNFQPSVVIRTKFHERLFGVIPLRF